MNTIQDQIIEQAGQEMAREIDREILWGMLVGIGWTRVMISHETAMVSATLIKEWLEHNCVNSYEKHRTDFIFEDNKEATMFILRWA